MQRTHVWIAGLLVTLGAAVAHAHGGAYQPPPPGNGIGPSVPAGGIPGGPTTPGGGPRAPAGPTTPGGGPVGGPTTGGGGPGKGGPLTPGGGSPLTPGGGSPLGPTTPSGGLPTPGTGSGLGAGPTPMPGHTGGGVVGQDHWTRWWYANRRHIIDWSTRVATQAGRDRTPGTGRPAAGDGMWQAEVQVALHDAIRSKNEDLASGAAVALGKLGDPSDAPALSRLLHDTSRQQPVREAAALALGLLPTDGEQADDARRSLEIVARSDRAPERLRAVAVYALGLRGEQASLPALLELAHSSAASWDVPAAAVGALGLGEFEFAQPDLIEMLDGPKRRKKAESVRRAYAAQALAGFAGAEPLDALRHAALDSDVDVRRAAALALGRAADAADDETMDILARMIARDRDTACQAVAALALGRIGHRRAEPALRQAYLKGNSVLRPFAALGLGLLARHDGCRNAADVVVHDLEETSNADVRASLAIAAGLSGNPDARPVLRDIVANRGDPALRGHAAMALGLLDDRVEGAPLLRELLVDARDPDLQREVALALGMLGDREAARALIKLVEDGSTVFVQGSAAVALGGIGGEAAGRALLDLLQDEKRPDLARAMAAVGLGLLVDPTEGRRIAAVGADLDWYLFTPTVAEVLTIL